MYRLFWPLTIRSATNRSFVRHDKKKVSATNGSQSLERLTEPAFSLGSANLSSDPCGKSKNFAATRIILPLPEQRHIIRLMDAKRKIRSIRKATCSIALALRMFAIIIGLTLCPLGISFSTCQCSACECVELEHGCCCDGSPSGSCCSSDGCRITCDDEANHSSCECQPCP